MNKGPVQPREKPGTNKLVISRGTSWKAMLSEDERDATEEIAALEAEHGPFLSADCEG